MGGVTTEENIQQSNSAGQAYPGHLAKEQSGYAHKVECYAAEQSGAADDHHEESEHGGRRLHAGGVHSGGLQLGWQQLHDGAVAHYECICWRWRRLAAAVSDAWLAESLPTGLGHQLESVQLHKASRPAHIPTAQGFQIATVRLGKKFYWLLMMSIETIRSWLWLGYIQISAVE